MRRRTQNNCKLFKSKLRQTKNCKINERMNAENNDNINQGQKNTNRTRNADYIFSHCVSYTQTHARTETLLPVMRQPLQYLVVVFVFIAAAAVAVIVTILFLTHSKYNRLNFFSSFNVFFIFSSSFLFFHFNFFVLPYWLISIFLKKKNCIDWTMIIPYSATFFVYGIRVVRLWLIFSQFHLLQTIRHYAILMLVYK